MIKLSPVVYTTKANPNTYYEDSNGIIFTYME